MTLDGNTAFWAMTALSALTVLLWAAFLFLVPWCAHSIYRYRLWAIRDGLVDDIAAGHLPEHPTVLQLVEMTEGVIGHTKHFTMREALIVGILRPSILRSESPEDRYEGLTAGQKSRLNKYETEIGAASIKHLLAASPLGWFVAACALPAAILGWIVLGRPPIRQLLRTVVQSQDSPNAVTTAVLQVHVDDRRPRRPLPAN